MAMDDSTADRNGRENSPTWRRYRQRYYNDVDKDRTERDPMSNPTWGCGRPVTGINPSITRNRRASEPITDHFCVRTRGLALARASNRFYEAGEGSTEELSIYDGGLMVWCVCSVCVCVCVCDCHIIKFYFMRFLLPQWIRVNNQNRKSKSAVRIENRTDFPGTVMITRCVW